MSLHKLQYTSDMLREAYNDVSFRGMAIRKAARQHGVPESTLRLRLSSQKPVAKMGAPTLFTNAQEEQLAEHCIKMAHLGYGYTRWQIIDIAKRMCEVTGRNGTEPTKHWFYGFLNRFNDIKMMNPKKREKARDEVSDETLNCYFSELKKTMEKINVKDVPANIWNVDETAINLDHNPPKILAKAGTHPHVVTAGRSANTTLIAAGSALGQTIPPYIIFKGERLSKENCSKGLKGTQYRATATGWSNASTFLDFFHHFLQHVKTRPCLLLYDGHSTHVTADVIETARKEDVHLFVLPPHSSHILQPLDVSVFSPFKKSLNSEFHKFLHLHPNSVITIDLLPEFIANSYKSSMTVSNIMAGFRKSGIFPLNPTAPVAHTPTINRQNQTQETNRKERKDNRNVKILFEEKDSSFIKNKDVTNRKKKTFVPPYGATITDDTYFNEAKKKQEEKRKQEEKEKQKEASGETKTGKKRKQVFSTPFIVITDQEQEKENVEPPKKAKVSIKKGKGPKKSGKKTSNKLNTNENSTTDEENCSVCGKWQPDGLHLEKSLKFVPWGQCNNCNKWVHLKFCSDIESLGEEDVFLCPKCSNEQ